MLTESSAHAHWVEGAYSLRHERMTIFIYRPVTKYLARVVFSPAGPNISVIFGPAGPNSNPD